MDFARAGRLRELGAWHRAELGAGKLGAGSSGKLGGSSGKLGAGSSVPGTDRIHNRPVDSRLWRLI